MRLGHVHCIFECNHEQQNLIWDKILSELVQ